VRVFFKECTEILGPIAVSAQAKEALMSPLQAV
jgi:hypothetical protein